MGYLSTKSLKMSKIAKKQFKAAQNKAKKIMKKQSKPRALRKLQKSKPKRYMNPYLCFLQEQRKLFKGGKLLSDWRLAHKGLGAKWRAWEQERQGIRGKERCQHLQCLSRIALSERLFCLHGVAHIKDKEENGKQWTKPRRLST